MGTSVTADTTRYQVEKRSRSVINVEGGTLDMGGPNFVLSGTPRIQGAGTVYAGNLAVLHGITLASYMNAVASVSFQDSFTMDGGTLDLGVQSKIPNEFPDSCDLGYNQSTFAGTGLITFNGMTNGQAYTSDGSPSEIDAGPNLVFAPGITLKTAAGDGVIKASTITSQGNVLVTPGRCMTMNGTVINAGTMTISQGDLVLNGPETLAQIGIINRTGGSVYMYSLLSVPSGVLDLDETFQQMRLSFPRPPART
jgi:hypothetical protein